MNQFLKLLYIARSQRTPRGAHRLGTELHLTAFPACRTLRSVGIPVFSQEFQVSIYQLSSEHWHARVWKETRVGVDILKAGCLKLSS